MEKMIYDIIEKLFAEKNKALEEGRNSEYIQGIEKALQIIKEA